MNKQEEIIVDLKSLVGKHTLSAVECKTDEILKTYDDSLRQIMLFTLDNKTYKAIEDDNDGYRSVMEKLVLTDEKPSEQFEPIKVICRHTTKHLGSDYGSDVEDDMLEFLDAKTGEILLEVGTENVGDYYPGFVATFHKERIK